MAARLGGESDVTNTVTTSVSGWGELPDTTNEKGTWGDSASGWGCSSNGWGGGGYSQPHRWNTESPINWEQEDSGDEENMEDANENVAETSGNVSFVQQVTPDTYAAQTDEYTKAALDQLLHSPEYQRYHTRCQLCWCVWSEHQFSPSCFECGGYAMQRPCPVCEGKCGTVWKRDVDLSHSEHSAHWDGDCGLPPEVQMRYLQQIFRDDATEEDVLEGLEDLNTG